ncbi:MAG: hypothetical protein ABI402_06890 [Ferruginibacter sp.]
MKKQFSLFVAAMAISISSLMAQAPARQMPTPEERTKVTMEKLADFNLKTDVRTKVETILTDFYKAQQSAMQEMRANGGGDRTAFQDKRKQLAEERDGKLKQVLTAEEYGKWISDIEPSLRPQRQAAPATAPAPTTAPAKPN